MNDVQKLKNRVWPPPHAISKHAPGHITASSQVTRYKTVVDEGRSSPRFPLLQLYVQIPSLVFLWYVSSSWSNIVMLLKSFEWETVKPLKTERLKRQLKKFRGDGRKMRVSYINRPLTD